MAHQKLPSTLSDGGRPMAFFGSFQKETEECLTSFVTPSQVLRGTCLRFPTVG